MSTDYESVGIWDASQISRLLGSDTIFKYRQGIYIADPDVADARLRLSLVNGAYRLPVYATPTNFWNEVAQGNVPGHTAVRGFGRNPKVGTVFEDIWDHGGTLEYPTANEQWYIVSTSANDTAAGSGAQRVTIRYLDENYAEQTVTVELNGTTNVLFPAADQFRPIDVQVDRWGATGENEGNIFIRQQTTDKLRCGIYYDDSVAGDENGLNSAQDFHYTCPAGKTAWLWRLVISTSKNHDIVIRGRKRLFGEGGFQTLGEYTDYQSTFPIDFEKTPIKLEEKSDFKITARSNNAEVPVSIAASIIEVDNG